MKLRHLRIFITVADLGNMTQAAKALFMAQPSVSQAIAELEEFYGVKLFERLSRKLYLTESGKNLLGYARHIVDLCTETEQALKNEEKSGLIKIGASLTVGACFLPRLVKQFLDQHKTMQIQGFIKNTTDIEQLILRNRIDFAVVEGALHLSGLIAEPFVDDHLALVCGPGHPLYQSPGLPAAALSRHSFIVREPGSGTRELFEGVMAAQNISWSPAWECNGSDGLKSVARQGLGIAVISRRLVEDQLKTGELWALTVDGLDFSRKFSIIYHKNKFLTPPMTAFIDLCRQPPLPAAAESLF